MSGVDPSPERSVIAAFDVDGTITTRDCVVPFMRRVTGARRIVPRLAVRPDRLLPTLARRDRDRLKELAAAAAFRGRSERDLHAHGIAFAREVHDRWLRGEIVERLHQHVAAGDRVVLVSASFELYLRPLAELLGAEDVLATRLEVTDGEATGALSGPNCRGPEKVRRLHQWMDAAGLHRADAHVIAYGDSSGDRDMLADADDAHWVGKGRAA